VYPQLCAQAIAHMFREHGFGTALPFNIPVTVLGITMVGTTEMNLCSGLTWSGGVEPLNRQPGGARWDGRPQHQTENPMCPTQISRLRTWCRDSCTFARFTSLVDLAFSLRYRSLLYLYTSSSFSLRYCLVYLQSGN